ncbi:MAG: ATP-binding cassette domain-containing protein [Gordonia sp. (in: high G+C Gram-positive bacteria)]
MSRGFNGAVMRAFGARDHLVTVTGTAEVTSHCLRVRFQTQTLFDEVVAGPTSWIRCWFPDGKGKEFQRAYTFSECDPDAGTFALDFVLHEPAGPASTWAKGAQPGQSLSVMYMSSTPLEIPAADGPAGYLLIGDAASIPAINTIIPEIPETTPIELYLEEHDAADHDIPLRSHPRLQVRWVKRVDATSLAAALPSREWSDWYLWAGPESNSLKEIRKKIKEFGFPRSETHVLAYWAQGKAMGKERDPEAEAARADQTSMVELAVTEPAVPPQTPVLPQAPAPAHAPASDELPVVAATEATPAPSRWRAAAAGRLLAPLKRTLIVAGILQAIVTLVRLAPYVLLVELARRLLSGAQSAQLWSVGILALILLVVGTLLDAALVGWLHSVDARFARDLRQRVIGKLARLPLGWFTDRNAGAIKTLITDNTLSLHYLVTHAVLDAVAAVVAPIGVLVYLFTVDWGVALFLFLPVLGYIITMYRMMIQSGAKIPLSQKWVERMNGEAGSYLAAQPVIRVFGGAVSSRFQRSLGEYIDFLDDWQRPFVRAKTIMDIVTRPITFLWLIGVVGTFFVIWNWIAPVDLLPFLLLGTTFGARLLGIGYGLAGLRTGMVAARDIQNALDEQELVTLDAAPAAADVGDTAAADSASTEVVFDHVGFGYRRDVPVLHDISLTLRPASVTALVGPSGSGKSTLASLLARFYDVDTGAIRIGGRDIRTMDSTELYRHIGFVFQDTQLVAGTVAENIALAVPDASRDRIEAAARAANIHERITRMPQGYDTVLGADAALSGGERQRLTIARAVLADAPVLILDEATAFADPESEYLVQQSLSRLAANRTVLVIAHRLHTIVDADRIVVLDGGRIVETGTHQELLATAGRYRDLWESTEGLGRPATTEIPADTAGVQR